MKPVSSVTYATWGSPMLRWGPTAFATPPSHACTVGCSSLQFRPCALDAILPPLSDIGTLYTRERTRGLICVVWTAAASLSVRPPTNDHDKLSSCHESGVESTLR